jgi:guanosine-diphosphatase
MGDQKYQVEGRRHKGKEAMCLAEAGAILNKNKPCPHGDSCSFAGVFQPPAGHFPDELYAFSYFYDRTESMASPFPESVSIVEYRREVVRVCNHDYDDAKLRGVFESNPHVCMDLSFIHQLLSNGYGLEESTSLSLAKKIKGYETGWCMGAMMKVLDDHDALCRRTDRER